MGMRYIGDDEYFQDNLIRVYNEAVVILEYSQKIKVDDIEKIEKILFGIIVYASNFLPSWFSENKQYLLNEIEKINGAKQNLGLSLSANILDIANMLDMESDTIREEKSSSSQLIASPTVLINYQNKLNEEQGLISSSMTFFKAPLSSSAMVKISERLVNAEEDIRSTMEYMSLLLDKEKILQAMKSITSQAPKISFDDIPEDATPLEKELLHSAIGYNNIFQEKQLNPEVINETEQELMRLCN